MLLNYTKIFTKIYIKNELLIIKENLLIWRFPYRWRIVYPLDLQYSSIVLSLAVYTDIWTGPCIREIT